MINVPDLAPVALFVYNRPWHTLQTLQALSRNHLASSSILYIFADGPKTGSTEESLKQIKNTREAIRAQLWCKQVIIIEAETNKGLADSIVQGVSQVIAKHGKVIVLEDDILTSESFLTYMNESLHLYQQEERVMHISAYSYPIPFETQFFLYPGGTCWGWATWQRAWQHFNPDASYHARWIQEKNLVKHFDFNGSKPLFGQLMANVNGIKKTWAILWRASIYEKGGCTLYPPFSLTRNIGTDGSGTNTEQNSDLASQHIADNYKVLLMDPKESGEVIEKIYAYYSHSHSKPLGLKDKIKRIIKRFL